MQDRWRQSPKTVVEKKNGAWAFEVDLIETIFPQTSKKNTQPL